MPLIAESNGNFAVHRLAPLLYRPALEQPLERVAHRSSSGILKNDPKRRDEPHPKEIAEDAAQGQRGDRAGKRNLLETCEGVEGAYVG